MSTESERREALAIVDRWADWIENQSQTMDDEHGECRIAFRREHQQVRRALSEPAAPSVPKGWKLVPIEPTTEGERHEAAYAEYRRALETCYEAINKIPEDAMGAGYADVDGRPMPYPIRDEILDMIAKTLSMGRKS